MTIKCSVSQINTLATDVYQVLLKPEQPFDFLAGQYITVVMGEKDHRAFSIANNPLENTSIIELHIGAPEGNTYAGEVMTQCLQALKQGSTIELDGPHGEAHIQNTSQPILLIAGGTGFSYAYSILMAALTQKIATPVYFYWGAKTLEQLYLIERLSELANSHENLTFVPVLEEADADWIGKKGNVLEAIADDFTSLANTDIYIAGRFEMAKVARDQFVESQQASVERLFGDAYAFI